MGYKGCKDCKDRTEYGLCHDTCEKYLKWKKENAELKKKEDKLKKSAVNARKYYG